MKDSQKTWMVCAVTFKHDSLVNFGEIPKIVEGALC